MGRIILTGGIASGKTTVAELFKQLGIIVIDADEIAKNIFKRNIPKIQEMFSTSLSGNELRAYVAEQIFSNPRMKFKLESFMHPKIQKIIKKRGSELKNVPHIFDIPLYYETKQIINDDFVIVVSIKYETQLNRLMERNNLTEEQAKKRILSQLPTAVKEKKANCIIDNNGSLEKLEIKVNELLDKLFCISGV